jgi:hypothetical protein
VRDRGGNEVRDIPIDTFVARVVEEDLSRSLSTGDVLDMATAALTSPSKKGPAVKAKPAARKKAAVKKTPVKKTPVKKTPVKKTPVVRKKATTTAKTRKPSSGRTARRRP